jgi:hypothetical protein
MKRLLVVLSMLLFNPVLAAEPAKEPPHEHRALSNLPPAFEHLKVLVGEWQMVGEGHEKSTSSFEVVANGSAIMERLSPAGESPMINMYHPDGDAVVMTHYCGAGNQPRLRCTKDGSSLAFTMTDITNWKKGDTRMSGLTLVLVDADHVNEVWTSDEGPEKGSFTIEMVRKK